MVEVHALNRSVEVQQRNPFALDLRSSLASLVDSSYFSVVHSSRSVADSSYLSVDRSSHSSEGGLWDHAEAAFLPSVEVHDYYQTVEEE